MIDERRDCHAIVRQLSAGRTPLERATEWMVSKPGQCPRGSKANEEEEVSRLTDTFIKRL